MRVLGVTPSSVDVSWALVEGTRSTPVRVALENTKQKFPKTQNETQTLRNLYQFVVAFLKDHSVEKVSILGKYELQEENTQGMNAYAFKAKHVPLNRNIFLKIYDASSERSDIFKEPRFLVEATSGTNSSAHLVNVLDAEKLNDD